MVHENSYILLVTSIYNLKYSTTISGQLGRCVASVQSAREQGLRAVQNKIS